MSETVNVVQAAQIASVTRRTIYNWLHAGRLPHIRDAGGAVRIPADSLQRLIREQRVAADRR